MQAPHGACGRGGARVIYLLAADAVALVHLGFILYAVFGGLLLLRWPRSIWLHLPVIGWATAVEWAGWLCPLTPLEWWLRSAAGETGHGGSFIEHHLLPLIYPTSLTRGMQLMFGGAVLAINVIVYAWVFYVRFRKRNSKPRTTG